MQKLLSRLTLITIILLSILFTGYSQDNENPAFTRSIGLDLTFINNFLPFGNNIGNQDDHLFHFFKYKENNKFNRQAFDIGFSGNFANNERNTNVNDRRIDLQYKISKGKRKTIFKNGYVLYGGELPLRYFYSQRAITDPSSTNPNDSTVTDLFYLASIGPFLGFEYKFSKRFSVYTEGGAYLNFSYSIDEFESEINSSQNFRDTNFFISNTFNFPASIILLYYL